MGGNKQPLIDWKQFQSRLASDDEITSWFTSYPEANVGIVTGKISNLTVVDIDPRHGGTNEQFIRLQTVQSRTAHGGWHYFFTYEPGMNNKANIRAGVDVRSEGGFVVVPPSVVDNGPYTWSMGPFAKTPILPVPDFVKQWTGEDKRRNSRHWDELALKGVVEGARNDTAASVAGKLLKTLKREEWDTVAWELLLAWNERNKSADGVTKPLSEVELRAVFESIKKTELESSNTDQKEQSKAIQLLRVIEDNATVFFHDQYKDGFAAIRGDGSEILKLKSKSFRQFLFSKFYAQKIVLSNEKITAMIQALEGRAIFGGPKHELHARIVSKDGAIWYDLGKSTVHIDESGWRVSDNPPILFRKFTHQLPQVMPQTGGDIFDLCKFVNLHGKEAQLLFLVYTIAAFIPGFPHPILVLHGPQGAGKTTPLRMLKNLIDPSELKTLSAPDGIREFVQQASHHYFLFLDNMSDLPTWLSDALSRACTGDGFSKRELFTDDEDIIYKFERTIGLNGINLVVRKADLLDRSILLELKRIPRTERREEREFWQEFEAIKPKILGAIFSAVSKAMQLYPEIHLTSRPRMADFTHWGCAIAVAIGFSQEAFIGAYNDNISKQNDEAIEASPTGTAVMVFMSEREHWQGEPTDLFSELERIAEQMKIDTHSRDWPKGASWVYRKLVPVESNLAENGIRISRNKKDRPRTIIIERVKDQKNADAADGSVANTKNEVITGQTTMKQSDDRVIPADGVGDGGIDGTNYSASGASTPTAFPTSLEEEKYA